MNEIKITQNMTAEEMLAVYLNEDALKTAPQTVYRIQTPQGRVYYTLDEFNNPTFYTSVTTIIGHNSKKSKYLEKFMAEMGYEESINYMNERADYGTFMHIEINSLLITGKLDFAEMRKRLKNYIEVNSLPASFIYHEWELTKDLLAFARFYKDYNVKPLAIEIVLVHPDGFGGALDLPCELDIPTKGFWGERNAKGAPKETKKIIRERAIIDHKSGRKGFFSDHESQLGAYRKLWDYNYPELPINRLFNWAPKKWTGKTPTYHLKEQTHAKGIKKFDSYLTLSKIDTDNLDKHILTVDGGIDLSKEDLGAQISSTSLSELIKKK